MESNSPQTLKQYIKWLKKAEKKGYLYDNDEYARIKKELYQAKRLKELLEREEKSYRGFGYKYEPIKPVSIENSSTAVIEREETVVESGVQTVEVEVMEDTNEG